MSYIVHLCQRSTWEQAFATGEYRASSLEREGFIHCSRPDQVQRVALRFYRDLPGLILLWIAPKQVHPEIHWEEADGEFFPHIYGALNIDAVISIQDYDPASGILFQPEQ